MLATRMRMSSAASGGDPYFAYVVSLLHCDGTNDATTFPDVIGKTWSNSGTVKVKTAVKVWGTGSAFFAGGLYYLSTASSSDFDMGTGNFTIEFYANLNPIVGSGGATIIFSDVGRNHLVWFTTTPVLTVTGSGGNKSSSTLTMSTDTWYLFAVSRVGDTLYFFQDGVGIGTASCTGESFNFNTGSAGTAIGSNSATAYAITGYLDEIRVTKGVGRYNANYSVPTEAYPDF